jgi:hypothetical protein
MIKRLAVASALLILLAAAVPGDDADPRDKLIGKWQPTTSAKDDSEVWALETVGDSLRLSHTLKQKTEAVECNTMGRDCEVKLGGRKAKVSLWFNGDALVEMETRGPEVTKRRFSMAENDTLKLEVMPIVPPGKPETTSFKRAPASH